MKTSFFKALLYNTFEKCFNSSAINAKSRERNHHCVTDKAHWTWRNCIILIRGENPHGILRNRHSLDAVCVSKINIFYANDIFSRLSMYAWLAVDWIRVDYRAQNFFCFSWHARALSFYLAGYPKLIKLFIVSSAVLSVFEKLSEKARVLSMNEKSCRSSATFETTYLTYKTNSSTLSRLPDSNLSCGVWREWRRKLFN